MQVRYQAAPHTEALNYSRRKSPSDVQELTNFKKLAAQVHQLRRIDRAGGLLRLGVGGVFVVLVQDRVELFLVDFDGFHALERNDAGLAARAF